LAGPNNYRPGCEGDRAGQGAVSHLMGAIRGEAPLQRIHRRREYP
jgi:hypothetical protein